MSPNSSRVSENPLQLKRLHSNLIENFEGKQELWEGWKKNFLFVANACNWSEDERLLMLRTHIRGSAVSAIQNLPESTLSSYVAILEALDARYGSSNESTKKRLRTELSTIKQLEDEDLETFGDRVYSMTVAAHPATLSERDIQCFAVDAFFGGCIDKNAAFLAGLVECHTIRDAVDKVKAIQVQSLRTGSKLVNRQVSFGAERRPSYTYDHYGRDSSRKRDSRRRDEHRDDKYERRRCERRDSQDYSYRPKRDHNYQSKQASPTRRDGYRNLSKGPSPGRSHRDEGKSHSPSNGQPQNSSSSPLNYQQ